MLSFFPRDVLDEILNLIDSVSEGFPSYSYFRYNMPLNSVYIDNYAIITVIHPDAAQYIFIRV